MKKRPLSITILGWLFIAVGGVALSYHLSEFKGRNSFDIELALVCLVRLLALLGGAFLLLGSNWARWLLGAWMAFHIVLSAFHSLGEFAMHLGLFSVLGYFLFRPGVAHWFKRNQPAPGPLDGNKAPVDNNCSAP